MLVLVLVIVSILLQNAKSAKKKRNKESDYEHDYEHEHEQSRFRVIVKDGSRWGPNGHFIFGIHNHQPVGNFDEVIEDAFGALTGPLWTCCERHPKIRVVMHFSGCLLDFFLARHPDFIERLRALGDRGQVEFMTGGYYEPILPVIPDADKIGQIEKLSDTIERYLGQRPIGIWLAERVWEPQLPAILAQAGVRYGVLDDWHFRCAGLEPKTASATT